MASPDEWTLLVIGGGSAGMGAARAARRRGANVLLIQEGPIGGDCTFTGCVPSKALIAAAARGDPFSEAMARVRRAITTVAATESDDAFRREGIDVLHGRAAFLDGDELEVNVRRLRARAFVIATGSAPSLPPVPGLGDLAYLTKRNGLRAHRASRFPGHPRRGPHRFEMAQAFRRLGAEVIVLEAIDRLLPREEPEASRVVGEVLATEGICLRTGAKVTRAERLGRGDDARLHLRAGDPVDAARVLVATGRRPTTDGLQLDRAGVRTGARGFIVTDDRLPTTAPGIYAAGDVTGRLQFTHAADHVGRLAAQNALSRLPGARYRAAALPWVTFTDPDVAHVGMTEADAAARWGPVAFLPMAEIDRAIAENATHGFLNLICGPRRGLGNVGGGRVLGATIAARRAGEMIDEVAPAIQTGCSPVVWLRQCMPTRPGRGRCRSAPRSSSSRSRVVEPVPRVRRTAHERHGVRGLRPGVAMTGRSQTCLTATIPDPLARRPAASPRLAVRHAVDLLGSPSVRRGAA